MFSQTIGFVALTALLAGCSVGSLGSSEDIPLEDIIDIHVEGPNVITVNGTASAIVVATLPLDADQRLVTFESSRGSFSLGSSSGKSVSQRAYLVNGALVARVTLSADTTVTAVVTASVGEFRSDTLSIQFIAP